MKDIEKKESKTEQTKQTKRVYVYLDLDVRINGHLVAKGVHASMKKHDHRFQCAPLPRCVHVQTRVGVLGVGLVVQHLQREIVEGKGQRQCAHTRARTHTHTQHHTPCAVAGNNSAAAAIFV